MTSWELVIVTGASRGFGRACAIAYANSQHPKIKQGGLHFVLTARSVRDLNETKNMIISAREGNLTEVDIFEADLSSTKNLENIANRIFDSPFSVSSSKLYDKVTFINNAGSQGLLQPIDMSVTPSQLETEYNINILSGNYLTAQIAGRFSKKLLPTSITKVSIVNVSSLAAIQPFQTWGFYCSSKASRDLFHASLALEHPNDGLKVINYAPGPLDTYMQQQVRESESCDKELRTQYIKLKEEGNLLDPNYSAAVLVNILLKDIFPSGCHWDFYDVVDEYKP